MTVCCGCRVPSVACRVAFPRMFVRVCPFDVRVPFRVLRVCAGQVLALAGNSDESGIDASLLILISQTPELFSYITHKLYALVEEDSSHLPLVHVAIWCIGEFGEVGVRVCVRRHLGPACHHPSIPPRSPPPASAPTEGAARGAPPMRAPQAHTCVVPGGSRTAVPGGVAFARRRACVQGSLLQGVLLVCSALRPAPCAPLQLLTSPPVEPASDPEDASNTFGPAGRARTEADVVTLLSKLMWCVGCVRFAPLP
jgi:hypothetical protein